MMLDDLVERYALDPICTVLRLLRHFWRADRAGQPMLAFLAGSDTRSIAAGDHRIGSRSTQRSNEE
jgi:hypothetical protein